MYKRIVSKVEDIAQWFVLIIIFCILCLITSMSFLYCFDGQNTATRPDNMWLNLLAIIIVVVVFCVLGKVLNPIYEKFPYLDKIFLILTVVWACGFSYVFVHGAKVLPSSDAKAVYDIAVWMTQGNMQAVVPQGSYLSLWPFQTGLIFIFEKIMRLFNSTNPMLLQIINVFYVGLAIVSGYGFIKLITKRLDAIVVYLFAAGTYFPMFLFTTWIYGDVPSVAWISFSAWMFLWYSKKENGWLKWTTGLLGMCGAAAACLYRRNSLIFVIALILIAVLSLLRRFKWQTLLLMLATLLLGVCGTTFTQKYYEYYAQNICGKGVPTVAYIAMGMQEGVAAPGFWNGYHANLHMLNNYDYDETVRISKEDISKSLSYFGDNPDYMWEFYYQKIACQWSDGTYSVFYNIDDMFGEGRSELALDIIYGEKYSKLLSFMNIHQLLVYIGTLAAVVSLMIAKLRKEHIELAEFLLLVTVIGGFLFSIIWEGSSRYILPYPFLMLPLLGKIDIRLKFSKKSKIA